MIYGTKEYYENEVQMAIVKENLIKEAIAARLTNGQIKAEEFGTYAEIMKQAENAVTYAVDRKEEFEAKELAGQNEDTEGDDE